MRRPGKSVASLVGLLVDDTVPDEILEEQLLWLDPVSLIHAAVASTRIRAIEKDAGFRRRYMHQRPGEMRALMYNRFHSPGIMLDWMPQAIEDGVWKPTTAHFNGAIRLNRLPIVEIFLAHSAIDPGRNYGIMLTDAASLGHTAIVEMLLRDRRVKPESRNNRALLAACRNGHGPVVEILLRDGRAIVDMNVHGYNEHMMLAVRTGNAAILAHFLADGRVDPGADGNILLFVAITSKSVECAFALIRDRRVTPDRDMLRAAINVRSLEIVHTLLLDGRVDPVDGIQFLYYTRDDRHRDGGDGDYPDHGPDTDIEQRLLRDERVQKFLSDLTRK